MDDFDIFAFPTHCHRLHLPYTLFVNHHGKNPSYEPPQWRTDSSQSSDRWQVPCKRRATCTQARCCSQDHFRAQGHCSHTFPESSLVKLRVAEEANHRGIYFSVHKSDETRLICKGAGTFFIQASNSDMGRSRWSRWKRDDFRTTVYACVLIGLQGANQGVRRRVSASNRD